MVNGREMVLKGKGGRSSSRFPPVCRAATGVFGSARCHPAMAVPQLVAAPAASWSAGKGWRGEKCQDEYCIGSSRCQHHVCEVPPKAERGGTRTGVVSLPTWAHRLLQAKPLPQKNNLKRASFTCWLALKCRALLQDATRA